MSAQYGQVQGATYVACHLEPTRADMEAEREEHRTHAHQEAMLVTRRISIECDQFHLDAADAGCTNTSCQDWCHE